MSACSLQAVFGLMAVAPVMMVPLLMGGVDPAEVGRMVGVLFAALFMSLSVGMACSAQFKVDPGGDRYDVSRHPPAQLRDCRSSASCWMSITTSTVQSLSFWPVSVRGLCSRSHSVVTSLETPIFFISRWRQHLALAWCRLGFRFGGRRVPGRTGRRSQALSPSCARPRRFHAEPSYSTITRLFGWERDGDGGPCSFGWRCSLASCFGCGGFWRTVGGGWMRRKT